MRTFIVFISVSVKGVAMAKKADEAIYLRYFFKSERHPSFQQELLRCLRSHHVINGLTRAVLWKRNASRTREAALLTMFCSGPTMKLSTGGYMPGFFFANSFLDTRFKNVLQEANIFRYVLAIKNFRCYPCLTRKTNVACSCVKRAIPTKSFTYSRLFGFPTWFPRIFRKDASLNSLVPVERRMPTRWRTRGLLFFYLWNEAASCDAALFIGELPLPPEIQRVIHSLLTGWTFPKERIMYNVPVLEFVTFAKPTNEVIDLVSEENDGKKRKKKNNDPFFH